MAATNWLDLAKVDPGFDALLKSIPVGAAPALDLVNIDFAILRSQLAARKRNLTAAQSTGHDGVTVEERTIPTRDGWDMPIRIYKPEKVPEGGSPLIVFIHGGGFCLGDLDGEELNCRLFAEKLGCTAVNPDYRLAPEFPFPYSPLDCWDALKWAAENANSLGANPAAGFILGGTSAGGNISAALGLKARDEKLSPPLTGLALLIPAVTDPYHAPEKYKSELNSMEQNKDAPVLGKAMVDKFLDAYNPDPHSPLYNVLETGKFDGLPPTFFQVCGMDPLRDEALIYERLLREDIGTKTRLNVYPGVPHGFWSVFPSFEGSKKFVADTVDGVAWLLEATKP